MALNVFPDAVIVITYVGRDNYSMSIDQSGKIHNYVQIWQYLVRFGLEDPANHRFPSRHVDRSHEGLQTLVPS